MESVNPMFVLYGSKKVSTRNDTVFVPLSEISEVAVSLGKTVVVKSAIYLFSLKRFCLDVLGRFTGRERKKTFH